MNANALSQSRTWRGYERDQVGRYKRKGPGCFVHLLIIAFVLTALAYFFRAHTANSGQRLPEVVPPAAAAELPLPVVVTPTGTLMHLTGYTSRPEETDDTPCIAASNVDICKLRARNVNVCASNDYPFGTLLRVEKMGVCVVLDRMNRRYTGKQHLDWYFGKDLDAAMEFGIPDLLVTKI